MKLMAITTTTMMMMTMTTVVVVVMIVVVIVMVVVLVVMIVGVVVVMVVVMMVVMIVVMIVVVVVLVMVVVMVVGLVVMMVVMIVVVVVTVLVVVLMVSPNYTSEHNSQCLRAFPPRTSDRLTTIIYQSPQLLYHQKRPKVTTHQINFPEEHLYLAPPHFTLTPPHPHPTSPSPHHTPTPPPLTITPPTSHLSHKSSPPTLVHHCHVVLEGNLMLVFCNQCLVRLHKLAVSASQIVAIGVQASLVRFQPRNAPGQLGDC